MYENGCGKTQNSKPAANSMPIYRYRKVFTNTRTCIMHNIGFDIQ